MSYLYVKWNSSGRGLLASSLAIKACCARCSRRVLSERVAFCMPLGAVCITSEFPVTRGGIHGHTYCQRFGSVL